MAVIETRASLRVINRVGGSAAHVGDVLGLDATDSFEPGPYGRFGHVHAHAQWNRASPLDGSADLDEHLRWLCAALVPRLAALEQLVSEGYELDLFCFVSEADGQGGVTLPAACLSELAKLRMDLGLDIYASPESEEELNRVPERSNGA